jgi:biotin carboxyl carrier protein
MDFDFTFKGEARTVCLENTDGVYKAILDGRAYEFTAERIDGQTISLLLEGRAITGTVSADTEKLYVHFEGGDFVFDLPQSGDPDSASAAVESDADRQVIVSPMPGKVVKVQVTVGQAVEVGETCIIVEAMKMEHSLNAAITGTVTAVHAGEGDPVDATSPLVEIERCQE